MTKSLTWCQKRLFVSIAKYATCCHFPSLSKNWGDVSLTSVANCTQQNRKSSKATASANTTKTLQNDEYCRNLVKKCDYENYLCSLLWRGHAQRASFAIRAFNVEVAQVHEVVSEKQIGLMRLQFWHDSLDKIIKGSPPNTPVALELSGATKHFKLRKRWLRSMIEARYSIMTYHVEGKDLYGTLDDLEDYGEKAMSAVVYLHLQLLGINTLNADHAASHIGKAQALVTVLRSTPYHASKRRLYLPREILLKHKVSEEVIFKGSDEKAVRDICYDIATRANTHLEQARTFSKDLPKESQLTFLPTAPCIWYLDNLQKCGFNVFDPKVRRKNGLLASRLMYQKWKKSF